MKGKRGGRNGKGARRKGRRLVALLALTGFLLLSVLLACMFGSIGPFGPGTPERMPEKAVFDILTGQGGGWPDLYNIVVTELRLPRIVLAGLIGAGLAVAGAIMQALFRNPMADPYILGLSAGASLGAGLTLAVPATVWTFAVFGSVMMVTNTSVLLPFLTFLGALGAVLLVFSIARTGGKVNTDTLLLSGIAVSAFLSAIVMFLLFIAGHQFKSLFFWMLGGFGAASWGQVAIVAPVVVPCVVLTVLFARDLNLLLTGEETARNLGMNVGRVKWQLLLLSSLLTGICVAFAGIIGFVGLIIPHIIRIMVGPDHRYLVPASALAGAIFLVWVDTAARTMMAPTEIPVGILTAMTGGPFFLYLLRTSKRTGRWAGG